MSHAEIDGAPIQHEVHWDGVPMVSESPSETGA
jgi:hypothetical protein